MTMIGRLRGWLAPALVALALCMAATHAVAQTAVPVPKSTPSEDQSAPAAATREDLQNMLDTLRDPAKRDELAKQIETMLQVQQAEAPPPEEQGIGARMLGAFSAAFQRLTDFMEELGRNFGASGNLLAWLELQASDPTQRAMWMEIGEDLALSLGAGLLVAYVINLAVKAGRKRLAMRAGDRLFRRIRFAAVRFLLELLPIIAFGIVALVLASWAAPIAEARLALLAIINATLISMAGAVIARFLFSPFEPGLRLFPLSDSTAVYLYIWTRRMIVVGVWGYVLLETAVLLGLPPAGYVVAAKILGFILTALLVVLVLQNREHVAHWIHGRPVEGGRRIVPGAVRSRLAEVWHIAVVVYLVGIYLVWAFNISDGFFYLLRATIITALVIGAVAVGEKWVPRLFNRFSGVDTALTARYPVVAARANRYIPIFRRIVIYAVRIAAVLVILAAWRVDVTGFLFGETGRTLLGRATDIAIVLVLALAAWEILGGIVYAKLNQRDDSGYRMLRSARARTLLPLIRNVLLIVISTMATLVVLSEIGVDIAPLLAGAGVVGLAVGFGAQSLVKDVITGAFFLFEDTVSIGDVINVDGKGGQVEGMTIRSMRLRDYNGDLHTINFGSVATITNMTRDFSYYLCDVKVAYRYAVDQVIKALKDADEELRKDTMFQHDILAPIEIAGVESFADTTYIVRSRIKTRPIRQWDVGRAFLRRLKQKFEERDIQLAVPALPANVVVSDTAGKQAHVAAAIGTRRRRPDQPPPGEEPAAE
jgi:moderate conductance mechanosensitive channel